MNHIIIGTGPAGVIAAETIRKNAPSDEILLIGEEAGPPYSRMAIPQLLSGQMLEVGTRLRRENDHFARLRIGLRTGRVVHINSRTQTVKMDDGDVVGFDKLLIASGASPRVPPISGIEFPGVHACWTLHDAHNIMRFAHRGAKVILIGAGFIGCIVMEALAARGVDLTVIESRDRMLPNMMGKGAGEVVRRWCERKGIKVLTSTRVVSIGGIGRGWEASRIVRLSDGQQLPADLVVYSAGTVPNVGFLQGSGIRCLQGVVVDASMQTNVPGIYAAGDCAESFDSVTGRSFIAGVQPNAADQAYCAALNMTGRHAIQRGVRQIDVLDTMGLISSSFGQWQGARGGQWVEMADEERFKYMRLEFSNDVLIGCNTVGIAEHATILRTLIQHHVHLGSWKDKILHDPTLLKVAYRECVQEQYMREASAFHVRGNRPGAAEQVV